MFSDIYVLVGNAMPVVQYVKIPAPDLTETLATLPANLLFVRIELRKPNGDIHHAQEERIQRRPGKPNMYAYAIPYMDCEIHTFVHNMGNTAVSLKQICLPTQSACLAVVPPNDEIELPFKGIVSPTRDKFQGFDLLDSESKHTLLELRFLYAAMPALVSTESEFKNLRKWRNAMAWSKHDPDAVRKQEPVEDDDTLFDHSPNERPKRTSWWPFGGKSAANAGTSKTGTRCDVIAENALEDTEHTAVLAHMRAMLA